MMEVAYAGNKGTNLAYFLPSVEMNQLHPSLLSQGNALLEQVPNPFFGIIRVGSLATATVQRGQMLRPYPQYTGFQAKNAGWATSNYHALQARFERRFTSGMTMTAAYTFSKTISDAADGLWNMANGIRNHYCLRCERAVSSYDQPQRFVTNMTYELPFGRGKQMGANMNSFANARAGQLASKRNSHPVAWPASPQLQRGEQHLFLLRRHAASQLHRRIAGHRRCTDD